MQKSKTKKKLINLVIVFALVLSIFTFVPVSVDAGGAESFHTMVIKSDGSLWAWGAKNVFSIWEKGEKS